MTFQQKADEIYELLVAINWTEPPRSSGREVYATLTPDYGQPRTKGHPKLVYRLIDPYLEAGSLNTNMIPRVEVQYEIDKKEEDDWINDLDKLRRAFSRQQVEVFNPTSDLGEEEGDIYHRVVIIVA